MHIRPSLVVGLLLESWRKMLYLRVVVQALVGGSGRIGFYSPRLTMGGSSIAFYLFPFSFWIMVTRIWSSWTCCACICGNCFKTSTFCIVAMEKSRWNWYSIDDFILYLYQHAWVLFEDAVILTKHITSPYCKRRNNAQDAQRALYGSSGSAVRA